MHYKLQNLRYWETMVVPRNLLETYNQIRNESVQYLIDIYGAIQVESKDKNKFPVTMEVKTTVADLEIFLLISLPFNFPDSFPQIKLNDISYKMVYPLPHLSTFKTLCLFDDVVASPNPENPFGVLEASIEKAKEILLKGILKQNIQDYSDEFETYWAEEAKGRYLSIVQPTDCPKEVYLVPFKYADWYEKGIFSDQKSEAINWIQNLGGVVKDKEIIKVLYIPIPEVINYPFPKKNIDIYHLLKNNKIAINSLFQYLTKNTRPSKVLFSMKSNEDYSWGIWEHIKPFKQVVSKYKGRKRLQTGLNGFRRGAQYGFLEIVKEFPRSEINKYSIKDVRATRLKIRGGDGKTDNQGLRVAVIGCGAVGSHIAQGLFDIGIQHILLIDHDELSFENINRHLCGANAVGQKKPDAIRNLLRRQYPTSFIQVYNGNVLSLLKDSPNALNSYELIIVAISHTPTELRLNELQLQNIINKPILNVWVEPYLAGGHGIWIEPNEKILLKMFFDDGRYKNQILMNGNQYSKKELGCSTSYVPYGVLELKKFIVDLLLFIQQQFNYEERSSKTYTWLGNLTEQRKYKRLLAPKWVGATDFTFRTQELKNNQEGNDLVDL